MGRSEPIGSPSVTVGGLALALHIAHHLIRSGVRFEMDPHIRNGDDTYEFTVRREDMNVLAKAILYQEELHATQRLPD